MALKATQFFALVLTALALVPAGAHLFVLPNKLSLPQEQYFIVQSIYRGWALFGFVWFGALAATLTLTLMLRHQQGPFWFVLVGFIIIASTLVIFFTWTYPANQATSNWTVVPTNWHEVRAQWEYSHAMNAVLFFVAFCCVTLSTLMSRN